MIVCFVFTKYYWVLRWINIRHKDGKNVNIVALQMLRVNLYAWVISLLFAVCDNSFLWIFVVSAYFSHFLSVAFAVIVSRVLAAFFKVAEISPSDATISPPVIVLRVIQGPLLLSKQMCPVSQRCSLLNRFLQMLFNYCSCTAHCLRCRSRLAGHDRFLVTSRDSIHSLSRNFPIGINKGFEGGLPLWNLRLH